MVPEPRRREDRGGGPRGRNFAFTAQFGGLATQFGDVATQFGDLAALVVVVVVAGWQITLRGDDPNGVALRTTLNVVDGIGGDLNQYRVLSYYVGYGLQHLFGLAYPPFDAMRFTQCVLIFGLAYALYGQLGLMPRTRLLGIGIVAGLISLSLGTRGPSTSAWTASRTPFSS